MHFIKHFVLFVALLVAQQLSAQKDSEVLFSVAGEPVTVGEFKYIYGKTSGEAVSYDESSVMEYLDLYQRFKLKVARARQMGLDTIGALQRELEGYRRQLADNYLIDKQVTNRLVEDLHQRQQEDIEFSHILLRFKGNPTPADTAALYQRALGVKEKLTAKNFTEIAKTASEDKFTAPKGGKVGFITAPFPRGMHQLEAALYNAPVNTVVGPVQTNLGYHLAIKDARRPARGEIELAHILVRRPEGTQGQMPRPAKLESAQKMLAAGKDFAEVAKLISEDGKTKNSAGYLGYFGINTYEAAFEDAAFALTEDGQVSEIIETKAGWHLLRRISKRNVQPLDVARPLLEKQVKNDLRFKDAEKEMLADIRIKAGVKEDKGLFGRYSAGLEDSTFLAFSWTPSATVPKGNLLSFNTGEKYTLKDFQNYLRKNSRKRVSLGRGSNSATVALRLYDSWVEERLLAYADARLEQDYPGFAALMREYREGILLFEATKIEVWDKASEDTTGLKTFFQNNRDDYQWESRATVTSYTVDTKTGADSREILAAAKTSTMDKVLDRFGRDKVSATQTDLEFSRLGEASEALQPEVGSATLVTNDMRVGKATFMVVEATYPPRAKELKEARGYVIADYQDQLEREWVDRLRKEFPVKVNKRTLNKLIQK